MYQLIVELVSDAAGGPDCKTNRGRFRPKDPRINRAGRPRGSKALGLNVYCNLCDG
jgi:hypothetical protein